MEAVGQVVGVVVVVVDGQAVTEVGPAVVEEDGEVMLCSFKMFRENFRCPEICFRGGRTSSGGGSDSQEQKRKTKSTNFSR